MKLRTHGPTVRTVWLVLGGVAAITAAACAQKESGNEGRGQAAPGPAPVLQSKERNGAPRQSALVQCNDFNQMLPLTADAPWGAVGYISNGCSATLIGPQHILTAAHCVVRNARDDAGEAFWQPNINFYPNYHPDRAAGTHPRVPIQRAVVGTRTGTGGVFQPSDWAIARLVTPVTDFPFLATDFPVAGDVNQSGGYPRDFLAIRALKGDMTACNAAPFPDEPSFPNPDFDCCAFTFCNCTALNQWWNVGFIDGSCSTTQVTADQEVVTSCSARGGSSGSPILWNSGNGFRVTGVVHGTGPDQCGDVRCGPETPVTVGPAQPRFRDVPWFASNAVVGRDETNGAITQVFAKDTDRNRIGRRKRAGSAPDATFGEWQGMAAPDADNFERLAAGNTSDSKPFLIGASRGTGALFELRANPDWGSWTDLDPPPGRAIHDVDLSANGAGAPVLIGSQAETGGWVFRRSRIGAGAGDPWGPWELLINGFTADVYTSVTTIRRDGDGVQMVFMSTDTGGVRWMRDPMPVSLPEDFSDANLAGVVIEDLDTGWLPDKRAFVVAVDNQSRIWFRTQNAPAGDVWLPWQSLRLGATNGGCPAGTSCYYSPDMPSANCQRPNLPDRLATITASRWMEASTVIPVLLATDRSGTIYYSTFEPDPTPCDVPAGCTCDTSVHWQPWRTFYHFGKYRSDR
jgi:hypothetical protein